MDDNTDTKRILSTLLPEDWRRPRGCHRITRLSTIQQDLISHNFTLPEAMDMAQKRSLWRMWTALRNLELHARNDYDDIKCYGPGFLYKCHWPFSSYIITTQFYCAFHRITELEERLVDHRVHFCIGRLSNASMQWSTVKATHLLTNLTLHYTLTISFQAQNSPFPQIFSNKSFANIHLFMFIKEKGLTTLHNIQHKK